MPPARGPDRPQRPDRRSGHHRHLRRDRALAHRRHRRRRRRWPSRSASSSGRGATSGTPCQPAFTAFPPGQGFMYGVWLMPGVLGAAGPAQARRRRLRRAGRVDRVGAARHVVGPVVVIYGLVQGAAGEIVLRVHAVPLLAAARPRCSPARWPARRRRCSTSSSTTPTGPAAGSWPTPLLLAASSAVVAGLGSWLLVRALARTGVLAPFAAPAPTRPVVASPVSDARDRHRGRAHATARLRAVDVRGLGLAARRPAGVGAARRRPARRAGRAGAAARRLRGRQVDAARGARRPARPRRAPASRRARSPSTAARPRPPAAGPGWCCRTRTSAAGHGPGGRRRRVRPGEPRRAADEIWRRVDEALAAVGFPYGRDRPTPGALRRREAAAGARRGPGAAPGAAAARRAHRQPRPGRRRAGARRRSRGCSTHSGATCVVIEHRVAGASTWSPGPWCSSPAAASSPTDRPPGASAARAARWRARGRVGARASARVARRAAGRRRRRPLLPGEASVPLPGPSRVIADSAATDLTVRAGRAGDHRAERLRQVHPRAGRSPGCCRRRPARCAPSDAGPHRGPTANRSRWRARDLVTRIGTVFQDPEHQFVTAVGAEELAVGPRALGLTPEARSRAAPTSCSSGCASTTSPRPTRTRSPAGRSAGSRSRPCSRRGRASSCWTNRRSGRTPAPGRSWSPCWPNCATPAVGCCSSPTTRTSSTPSPTTARPTTARPLCRAGAAVSVLAPLRADPDRAARAGSTRWPRSARRPSCWSGCCSRWTR